VSSPPAIEVGHRYTASDLDLEPAHDQYISDDNFGLDLYDDGTAYAQDPNAYPLSSSPPRSPLRDAISDPDSPARQKRKYPDTEIEPIRKAQKEGGGGGRPKAADWPIEVQEVLASGIAHYRALLSTINPYPDHLTEITWAKRAWHEGCTANDIEIGHTPELLKLVRDRCPPVRCLTAF
jgi:hypothetical protein